MDGSRGRETFRYPDFLAVLGLADDVAEALLQGAAQRQLLALHGYDLKAPQLAIGGAAQGDDQNVPNLPNSVRLNALPS
jgi:hypothetical protein